MRPTLKLILLIVAVSTLLGLYAMLPAKPMFFGDFGFRQIPLRRVLAEKPEWEQEEEVKADTTPAEPVDTAKQRILLFGDSMVGTLCYRMSKYAEQNGHTLECVAWASTTTHKWAQGNKICELVNDFKPTYVIICIGSNELYSKDMDGMESRVRKIIGDVGDLPVIWIGPPNWCKDGGINKVLLQVMGKKAYFPSMNLKLQRRPDGHHPSNAGAAKWMDEFAKWMRDGKSIHPILMNVPTRGVKGKMRLVVLQPENGVRKTTAGSEEATANDDVPAEASPAQEKTESPVPAAPSETE